VNSIDISIIIVNYNTENYLNYCLNSIIRNIKGINYEIIVVDNNSSDNSVNFIKKNYPTINIIQNHENYGYAKANNQGLKLAKGNFILLLNPDTEIRNNTIVDMFEFMNRNPRTGISGCRVINPNNKLQWDSCGSFLTPYLLALKKIGIETLIPYHRHIGKRLLYYWPRDSIRKIDWVSGVCMLIRKETMKNVGLLDEGFFAYMEDMDYCRRAALKNWTVYFLNYPKIIHKVSSSWQKYSKQQIFISLKSEKLYLTKYYGRFGFVSFKIFNLIGSYIKLLANLAINHKKESKDHLMILKWVLKNDL